MKYEPEDRMTFQEFRRRGYLQEMNRQFLHPLGLAIGLTKFGEPVIVDAQDDPEGIVFAGFEGQELDDALARRDAVEREWRERGAVRRERFGFAIQPVEDFDREL